MFGNHNKKRPNNLIIGMVELGVESFTPLQDFKTAKVASGSKSCLMFAGVSFADPANKEFQRLKNLLMDFVRGPDVTNVRLAGIEHVILRRSQLASDDLFKTACKQVCEIYH